MGVTQISKFRGVSENSPHPNNPYRTLKWKVSITVNGKRKNLLYTDDEEVAAREYDRWAKYYFKDKAVLNFPKEK